MQKKSIIPITDKKIDKLYKLWLENGFEKEEKIDFTKSLLRGSEKNINQINLYSIEKERQILSTVVLIFQIDNPSISGIGEVCTELNSRGNQFAYNLCMLARDEFFSIDGSQCNFLGTINPLAAKIYKKLGWKKIENSYVMYNSINYSNFDHFLEEKYIKSEKLIISEGSSYFRLSLIPFILSNKNVLYSDMNIGISSETISAACLSLYEMYNSLLNRKGRWFCMHNQSNQIYGVSTIITEINKTYKIDGFSNQNYKEDFYKLVDYTCNLALENDPMKIYIDVLNDDSYKKEIFSELGFIETNSYNYTFDSKNKKLCNRMELRN
tara:strand:+ start:17647 stop:18618 length:972 start_codon:yes stop_codon:yes gene_type:complete